jgi:hypothetical protein
MERQDALFMTIRSSPKSGHPFARCQAHAFCMASSALVTMSQEMKRSPALQLLPIPNQSQSLALFKPLLTPEQLEALSRCARGISIRFESWEIIDALVAGGYAEQGVAGVVTVTVKGQEYLREHAP